MNRLSKAQSPYLLQHANNPVDWYPWCQEAFDKAAAENKPVIISIGYAACHWCHVMERESFEDDATAAFMNEHFINIKVDREEHPGVDHFYMDAVQAISGSGGWPLNVFATPQKLPFYGGTYFPPSPGYGRPSWLQLMERMRDVWQNEGESVATQTEQMIAHLRQAGAAPGIIKEQTPADAKIMLETLLSTADRVLGGFGKAPKFPATFSIRLLLEHYHYTESQEALGQALLSLDKMMEGGIYDQLGGGFARYSTDAQWLAPHFEKMLYDNALIIIAMSDAYRATHDEKYKVCIAETIAFCNRELMHPSGGYYSALDADSEGVEGKFYTWPMSEWEEVLAGQKHKRLLEKHYGVVEEGNWEHTNILHQNSPLATIAIENEIPLDELVAAKKEMDERLFQHRKNRIRPALDDKCQLSWNALMNMALCAAAITSEDKKYKLEAISHMNWMLAAFEEKEELWHIWKDGEARIVAQLDDFAYLIQSLLTLAQLSSDKKFLDKANHLLINAIGLFQDAESGFFYFTRKESDELPVLKIEVYDGAMPSANALMAHNLMVAGLLLKNQNWIELAENMLNRMSGAANRYTGSFAYWGMLQQRSQYGWKTVSIAGKRTSKTLEKFQQSWLPEIIIAPADNTKTITLPLTRKANIEETEEIDILVCTATECWPPKKNFLAAMALISTNT